jgi:hypothetical protein
VDDLAQELEGPILGAEEPAAGELIGLALPVARVAAHDAVELCRPVAADQELAE